MERMRRHEPPAHDFFATKLLLATDVRLDGRELPLQVDGDYVGEVVEAKYSILPRALNVVA